MMMKSSKTKGAAAVLATALVTIAAPSFAGKNSTPGVTTATTSLSAVPPSSAATTSLGSGGVTGTYAVGDSFSVPAQVLTQIKALPGASTAIRDGETVTVLTVRLSNGETALLVVSEDGEATLEAI